MNLISGSGQIVFMRKSLAALVALAFLTTLFGLSDGAKATEQVGVSLYLLNIGDFNPSTGSFTADFYLDFKCVNTCPSMSYEFLNGRANYVHNMTADPNERLYRIQGSFNSPMDWSKSPFDRQTLSIVLGDIRATNNSINYTSNLAGSGVDPSVAVGGWKVVGFSASADYHGFGASNVLRPNYVFGMEISRNWLDTFLKLFLPILVLMIIVLSTFFTTMDKMLTRLGIVSTALVAAALFHVIATVQMPAPGFFTFTDMFMTLNYALLAAVFILNIVMMSVFDRGAKERSARINMLARMGMIAATAALYAILFIILA